MNYKNLAICFMFFLLLSSCKSKYSYLQNGDLIFIQAKEENLSGAISRVTKKENIPSYDHIGIIEKNRKDLFVLHAAPEKGSIKENIKDFLKDYNSRTIDVYRLKKEYNLSIDQAIQKANSLLKRPYNVSYVLNENSYYCSDFIERSFRKDSIFQLNPMTFINPKTGKTDEYWQEFYKKLNIAIPEGSPGCNPNGLSQSEKIFKVSTLKH
ncbi:YiiX/YebB-like N1pC/P60 family cysteine hydrolase [Frigoriflavimonas asaccharolytica]